MTEQKYPKKCWFCSCKIETETDYAGVDEFGHDACHRCANSMKAAREREYAESRERMQLAKAMQRRFTI